MSAKDKRKSGSTYRSIEANNKKLDAELFGESSEAGPSNIQTATSNVEFSEHPHCENHPCPFDEYILQEEYVSHLITIDAFDDMEVYEEVNEDYDEAEETIHNAI
ncbi:uncharacterized protein LOC121590662 [Anopheles merus]|uniref:uncharacterized protein LOC121590662 n=1 Tax=Anopheles merus TaxID=30066 RepID=UPI001BE41A0B|nr:uncharacterized protein LOC121590662 [Anopheles merus]